MTGVAEAQTQTDSQPLEHKASQTTNPVIMHIDLKRMQSKLRHCSPVDADNLVTPLSQFDRQAPGRISTSPTLRRMRSTRRPLLDLRDSSGAQEKPQIVAPSTNPPNPVLKMKSPTATNPPCDEEVCPDPPLASFHGKHKGLSQRSKTSGSIIVSTKQECHNSHPSPIKESESPDDELQVRFLLCLLNLKLLQTSPHKSPPPPLDRQLIINQEGGNSFLTDALSTSFCSASCSGHSQCELLTANESAVTCTDSSDQTLCLESPGKFSPRAPIHRSQQSPNNGGVSERCKKIMGRSIQPVVFKRAHSQKSAGILLQYQRLLSAGDHLKHRFIFESL